MVPKLRSIIDSNVDLFWNGSLSKYYRSLLSRKQLDEKSLKYLLEHVFVEGYGIGCKVTQAKLTETKIQKVK